MSSPGIPESLRRDNTIAVTIEGDTSATLPTGAATYAAQTDKSQFTKITDGTDTALVTAAGEVNVLESNSTAIKTAVEILDNAISGNEMQVDVITSALPSGASTSANQTTIIGHLDGVEGLLTTIDTDTGDIAVDVDAIRVATQLLDDTVQVLGTDTFTEASNKGITLGAVRRDADTTLVNTTNEFTPLQVDANGRLKVEAFSGETLPVSLTSTTVTGTVAVTQSGTWDEVGINDSGNSITVDNPVLSVVGGGTEATAQRVTIASDSTGVLSVDDNGSTLSIDDGAGVITTDGSGTAGTPAGGVLTVQGQASMTPLSTQREHLTVPFTTTIVAAVASTDAANYSEVSVQITSQGTSSTVTFQGSNDNTNWVSVPLLISTGVGSTAPVTSTTSASSYNGPNKFRYFRLSVTGISAGTTAGTVEFFTNTSHQLGSGQGIFSLVPGTGTTSLGKAEDAAHTSGDTGVMVLGIRDDTLSVFSGAENDYEPFHMTSTGRLYVSATVDAALPAGSNDIGGVDVLTVPAPLSTTGGGTEATALRVTLANDSTGVLSVDDNGSTLSIDDGAGSITVDNGGTFAVQDSQAIADNAGFTDGTSKVFAAGFIYDEVAGTALTENDAAAGRINVNRAQVQAIEDGVTRGRYATVSAANALKVDNSGVTQPVSGTVTANLAAGTNNIGDVDILSIAAGDNNIGNVDIVTMPTVTVNTHAVTVASGGIASGAIASGAIASGAVASGAFAAGSIAVGAITKGATSPVAAEDDASADLDYGIKTMAVRKATPANTSGTDGDYEMLQMSAGRLWTSATIDTALPAGTNAIGKLAANSGVDIGDTDVTSVIPGTGATNLGKAVDSVAGATDTGVMPLAVRDDALATLTPVDGDYTQLRTTSTGRLWVSAVLDTALPAGTASIGILGANSGVDIGDVTINNAAGASAVNIQDGGNTITIDGAVTNTVLSVVGGGTEATAQRVTIASDSTGVISVDDNAGSLTVDGTVTANLSATDNAVLDQIELNQDSQTAILTTIDADTGAILADTANIDTATTAINGKLPTSAASADAYANPTITQIGAENMLFNGSTWDRARGMSVATTTGDTGAKTATGAGATQTNVGNKGVQIFIDLGTVSGTTPTCVFKVQGSVNGGTTWYDLPGATTASLTATTDVGIMIYPGVVATAGSTTTGTTATVSLVLPRTWRMYWTIGGTTPSFTITSITYNYIPN